MRILILLALAAAFLAPAAQADPYYRLARHDWFSLNHDELQEGNVALESQGGPQSVGSGLSYSWDLKAGPEGLYSSMTQMSGNPGSLHTHRASQLTMRFDDVVFSDGTGAGGTIQVQVRVALDAQVSGFGGYKYSNLEMAGSGGLAGRWYASLNSSAPPSDGVFTGLDATDQLDGVFLSNSFPVMADAPTTVEIRLNFLGSAGGSNTQVYQDLVATFDPGQAFQLPAGYTANSVQAGIVDNQWSTATAVTPGPAGGLALRAWPNPFHPTTRISLVMPVAGPLEVVLVDLRGRRVRSLHAGHRAAGPVELQWDGRGEGGQRLPSGTYFARVTTPGHVQVQRLSLLR